MLERHEEYRRFCRSGLTYRFQHEVGQGLRFYPQTTSFDTVNFNFLENGLVDQGNERYYMVPNEFGEVHKLLSFAGEAQKTGNLNMTKNRRFWNFAQVKRKLRARHPKTR